MAARLERAARPGRPHRQTAGATADAAARHSGTRQASFPDATTDSRHGLPIAPNLLDRNFHVATPNSVWAGDITFIATDEGWLFLAVVIDLFSRQVVGWSLGDDMGSDLVIDAFQMAWFRRRPDHKTRLIFHSDRGSQYASGDYQKRLQEAGIICSMSRRGNCWDNAPTESFFASLKKEMVYRTRFETREQARSAIFHWIEIWYNRKRRHSAIGYISPEAFERQHQQNTVTLKAA